MVPKLIGLFSVFLFYILKAVLVSFGSWYKFCLGSKSYNLPGRLDKTRGQDIASPVFLSFCQLSITFIRASWLTYQTFQSGRNDNNSDDGERLQSTDCMPDVVLSVLLSRADKTGAVIVHGSQTGTQSYREVK